MSEEQGKVHHPIRQLPVPPALIKDPIAQCIVLILVTSAVFLAIPGIDIWFSNLFYDHGFIAGQLRGFILLRDIWRKMTAVIVVVLLAVLIIKLAWPYRKTLLRPRDVIFILSSLIIGPGIITNLIFKDNWGRPRPYMVENYGGHDPFVGVWKITHYCATNCSFISGEGSSGIWLVTLAVLLPQRFRAVGLSTLAAFGVVFSLNRVVLGAHFLSDVMLAWWITLLVIAVEYRLLYVNPLGGMTNEALEAWFTEAGIGLRQSPALLVRKITGRSTNNGPKASRQDQPPTGSA